MSTRSNIGILREDNTVEMIYCHFDGYLDGVGQLLRDHYADTQKIEALVGLGSISSLAADIGEKHDFRMRGDGVVTAYHRDRGEAWEHTQPVTYLNKEDALAHMEEYLYLWLPGETKWVVSDHGRPFVDLLTAQEAEE
jgi:hypothetical protein